MTARLLTACILALIAAIPVPVTLAENAVTTDVLATIDLVNGRQPRAHVLSGGQPTREQLLALHRAGVKHVINLRTAAEMDWDEAAYARSLGMQYHAIPVAGASGITPENAASLRQALAAAGDEPVLVHCASGNRVGALMAVSAAQTGASIDDAINEGQRWGLTRLKDLVREKLAASPQLCCADTAGDSTREQ